MNGSSHLTNGIGNGHIHKNGNGAPAAKKMKICPKEELAEFDKVFKILMDECLNEGEASGSKEIGDAMTHFLNVCDYNVPHGKKNRGVSVVASYRCLVPNPSDEELFKARALGWCVEWLQGYFLVADDIMDHSVTRRGQPCWYKKSGIGMIAINDSFYLEAAIYKILKKYFRSESYYVDILELFHETTLQTVIGQGLDLLTADDEIVDFSKFSMQRYDAIVKWKTAFYSFYLPVALALHMAEVKDESAFSTAKEILLEMGHFFQVQDDYLDCFGDPAVTGKIGTDIEDNKCGWLINKALLICSDEQSVTLEAHYAKKDPESVAVVKQIFLDLDLKKVYSEYEEESYQKLMSKINNLSSPDLPQEMFIAFAQKIFKRNK